MQAGNIIFTLEYTPVYKYNYRGSYCQGSSWDQEEGGGAGPSS